MRVVINHDQCGHGGMFADRCLAATIRNPLGHERYCTAQVVDDGRPELTVVLIFQGEEHTVVVTDANRELLATGGVDAFQG